MERIVMQCHVHPEKIAVGECIGCHKALCDDCRMLYQGQDICKQCLIDIRKKDVPHNLDDFISSVGSEFSKVTDDLTSLIKAQKIFKGNKSSRSESREGYLICEDCLGYYKLEKDESPDDFESCNCGGKLKFSKFRKVK